MGDNGDMDEEQNNYCRDFMRNVCNRANCKFVHPENIKIRTEPIFCHDYQSGECLSKRKQCRFIHCTPNEEEHYKQTGELPESASGTEYYDPRPIRGKGKLNTGGGGRKPTGSRGGGGGGGGQRGRNGFNNNNRNGRNMESNGYYMGNDNNEIPVCKDYLKGMCDRPVNKCKFRHVESQSYGGQVGGGNRRRVSTSSYYDSGPESKRNHYSTDYFDFSQNQFSPPPPPPPPSQQQFYSPNQQQQQQQQQAYQDSHGQQQVQQGVNQNNNNNSNGYNTISQLNDMSTGITSFSSVSSNNNNSTATAAAMKALEDENFMLKRRIEELKKQVSDLVATNEYLLSQNAHFRINNMTKEVQVGVGVQGQAGPGNSVLVSMAQPIGIQNPSLSCSVAASAPGLSTITTGIPTVSMTPVSSLSNHSISLTASPVVSMAQHPSQSGHGTQTVYPTIVTGVTGLPPN